jgi:hypothetical protein
LAHLTVYESLNGDADFAMALRFGRMLEEALLGFGELD